MPSIIRNTSGGTSVGGGALAPRSRRASTAQVDGYWRGGASNPPATVEYLVIGGGGGGGIEGGYEGGGGAGGYRNSTGTETSGRGASTESKLAVVGGVQVTVTVGQGGNKTRGTNSVLGSITSLAGGGGGNQGGVMGGGSGGGS